MINKEAKFELGRRLVKVTEMLRLNRVALDILMEEAKDVEQFIQYQDGSREEMANIAGTSIVRGEIVKNREIESAFLNREFEAIDLPLVRTMGIEQYKQIKKRYKDEKGVEKDSLVETIEKDLDNSFNKLIHIYDSLMNGKNPNYKEGSIPMLLENEKVVNEIYDEFYDRCIDDADSFTHEILMRKIEAMNRNESISSAIPILEMVLNIKDRSFNYVELVQDKDDLELMKSVDIIVEKIYEIMRSKLGYEMSDEARETLKIREWSDIAVSNEITLQTRVLFDLKTMRKADNTISDAGINLFYVEGEVSAGDLIYETLATTSFLATNMMSSIVNEIIPVKNQG